MRTVSGKIRMKLLSVVFVVMVSSFWAAVGQALVYPEEDCSREVVARLKLGAEVKAKVNAIFAEYKGKIAAREKAADVAEQKILDVSFDKLTNKASEDDVKAANEKHNEETKKLRATIHERDAKVKQALPLALATKFERGMKLVAERNAKYYAVLDETFARGKKDLQDGKQRTEEEKKKDAEESKKKFDAIEKEYDKKLDEQVGKLSGQK